MDIPTHTSARTVPDRAVSIDGYDILGYQAAVGSDAPDVQAAIRSVLRGFGPVDVGPGLNLPRYEIIATAVGWKLRVQGTDVQEDADLPTTLAALEWYVVSAALSERDDVVQVHGAALCLPTRREGLVLVGDSGSGKTTLAAALMLRGFTPFSDDVALIQPATLELRPVKRAFHLSRESRALLDRLVAGGLRWDDGDPEGFFSPPQWAETPVPIRWVLFPEFKPDREPQLVPLSPADAASAILAQSPNLARNARQALATAARLVERATIYRFLTGNLEASVAAVERLVASSLPV